MATKKKKDRPPVKVGVSPEMPEPVRDSDKQAMIASALTLSVDF